MAKRKSARKQAPAPVSEPIRPTPAPEPPAPSERPDPASSADGTSAPDIVGPSAPEAAELARVVAEIHAGGERVVAHAAAAGDDAEGPLLDQAERIAMGDPEALKALEDLTEADLADLFELGFGLVADLRQRKHWELSAKSAQRLGRCFKRSLDRHGWQWAAKWMPDVLSALFLGFEIAKRVQRDREIAAAAQAKPAAA